MYVCMWAHGNHSMAIEVRGQLQGVISVHLWSWTVRLSVRLSGKCL